MSLINFTEYFKELCEKEENKQIRESVINKIKHLYYINKIYYKKSKIYKFHINNIPSQLNSELMKVEPRWNVGCSRSSVEMEILSDIVRSLQAI